MAMNWTTSPGGLFVRIGALCKLIKDVRVFQNTTIAARETVVADLYHQPATPVRHLKYLTEGPPTLFAKHKQSMDAITASLLAQIRKTIMEQVHAEDPLSEKTDEAALAKLVELIKLDLQSLERESVSTTLQTATANSLNRGNPKIVFGVTDHEENTYSEGILRNKEYVRAESIELECVSESAGSGSVTVNGEAVAPHGSYLWPGGSGAGPSVTIADLAVDGSGEVAHPGNQIITNGDFEDFTANLPTGWTAGVGVAGTDFAKTAVSGEYHAGASGLKFIGTASAVATRIDQLFGAASSSGIPKDRSYLMCGFWIKGSSAAPGTGDFVVQVEISGSTLGGGQQGIPLAAGFPISWTFYSFLIINDAVSVLPTDSVKVGLAFGSDLTAGQFVYVDSLAVVPCYYHAGNLIAAFPGTDDAKIGDRWTVTIANARAAEFQFYLDMAYDLLGRGVGIPSGSPNTILDSLIA